MIKLQAIESFTLGKFDELENIERVGQDTYGRLNTGDKFECTKDLADYLLGDNPIKRAVAKVIEIIPEKEEPKIEEIEIEDGTLEHPYKTIMPKPITKKTSKKKISKK